MKKYDGCSGGMSMLWKKATGELPPWEGCCDLHDNDYVSGGTKKQRLDSDIRLLACVATNGHPFWAMGIFIAVRLGGVPWLPTPWRWGFGTRRKYYTK